MLLAGSLALAGRAPAQDLSPRLWVNDSVISRFEHDQRVRFLTLLRAPGDLDALAEKLLIEDRLRMQAAEKMELTLTAEQLTAGMTEFAARANLSLEQFLTIIGQAGVQPESFRDFVQAGLVWRDVVREKFGASVTVSNVEIDRALEGFTREDASDRVLLSELVLPTGGETDARNRLLAKRFAQALRSRAAFAGAAKKYSAAPSAARGGELSWASTGGLPPAVARVVAGMKPGEVSPPVAVDGALALFYLHDREKGDVIEGSAGSVEYAVLQVPGSGEAARAEAERIRADALSCDALYPVARKLGTERLERRTVAEAALPAGLKAEVARLDRQESRVATTAAGAVSVVMVCARGGATGTLKSEPRAASGNAIGNEKVALAADAYLEELRAAAYIRRP